MNILNTEQLICAAPVDYQVVGDLGDMPLIGDSLGGNLWMALSTFARRRDADDRYFRAEYFKSLVLEKKFFQTMKEAVHQPTAIPGIPMRTIVVTVTKKKISCA